MLYSCVFLDLAKHKLLFFCMIVIIYCVNCSSDLYHLLGLQLNNAVFQQKYLTRVTSLNNINFSSEEGMSQTSLLQTRNNTFPGLVPRLFLVEMSLGTRLHFFINSNECMRMVQLMLIRLFFFQFIRELSGYQSSSLLSSCNATAQLNDWTQSFAYQRNNETVQHVQFMIYQLSETCRMIKTQDVLYKLILLEVYHPIETITFMYTDHCLFTLCMPLLFSDSSIQPPLQLPVQNTVDN